MDKRQERHSHQAPGNTGPGGTDFVSASTPEAAATHPRGRGGKQQEGQTTSRGVGGYHGGETSEDGNLGGIDMK